MNNTLTVSSWCTNHEYPMIKNELNHRSKLQQGNKNSTILFNLCHYVKMSKASFLNLRLKDNFHHDFCMSNHKHIYSQLSLNRPLSKTNTWFWSHWTKKRICLSLLVEQIYCKFRVLMLLLICSWCKFCPKVKVYFSARVA